MLRLLGAALLGVTLLAVPPAAPATAATAPETYLLAVPPTSSTQAIAYFYFGSDRTTDVKYDCRVSINGTNPFVFTDCPRAFGFLHHNPGDTVTVTVAAYSPSSGLQDPTPATYEFERLTGTEQAPTQFLSGPEARDFSTDATFSFSGGTPYVCSLDDAPYGACTSPLTVSGLSLGDHRLRVRSTRFDGVLADQPSTYRWTVVPDTAVRPPTYILSGPPASGPGTTAGFVLASNGDDVTFQCDLVSGPASQTTGPTSGAPCARAVQFGPLAPGTWTLRAAAVRDGNRDLTPATYEFVITGDTPQPSVYFTSGPPRITAEEQSVLSFTAVPAVDGFECAFDGRPFTACSSPHTTVPAAAGGHRLQVRAVVNGFPQPAVTSYEWNSVPFYETPTVTASGGNSVDQTFTWAQDPSFVTFDCRLDTAAFAPCSPPVTITGLAPGTHTFEVRSGDLYRAPFDLEYFRFVDPTPSSVTVTVGAPDTSITLAPAAVSALTSASFQFGSDTPGATYECSLDDATESAFAACVSPRTYTGLAPGDHTFRVRAVVAGLPDPTPATHVWRIAPVPETTLLTRPAAVTGASTATFTVSSDLAGATFECSLDDAAFAACTSPRALTGLAPGAHSFQVRATLNGQTDATPASYTWTITGTPDTTITDGPPATTGATTNSVSFGSDLLGATFECSLNNAAYAACTSPRTLRNQVPGTYTLRVRATLNGNADATPASRSWEVLAVPNTTIRTKPAASSTATTGTFTFDASVAGSTFECALDGEAFSACTSPVSLTGLDVGSHTFDVRALNRGVPDPTPATYTWSVTAPPRAPQTTILTGPESPSASRTAGFTFEADVAGATFACSLDQAAFTACTSPYAVTSLAEGDHTLRVRATAGGLTDATPDSFAWTVDLAPTVTLGSRPAKTTGTTEAAFTFSSGDPQATFECELDDVVDDCTSPFSASVDLGEHTFGVTAVDAGGLRSAQAVYTWTVEEVVVPEAPDTLITVGPVLLSNSRTATFEFAAGGDATGYECRLDGAAFTDCASPYEVSGLADGGHTLQVRARNGDLVDATPAGYTWDVDATGPRVRISGLNGEVLQGTRVTAVFSSRDLDVVEYRCALDDAPLVTCASQVTYADLAPGRHRITAIAVDRLGNVTPQVEERGFTVEVKLPETRLRGIDGARFAGGVVVGQVASPADDVRFYECRLDGGAWQRCGAPRVRFTGVAPGRHVLLARAVDGRGYRDATPARARFRMVA